MNMRLSIVSFIRKHQKKMAEQKCTKRKRGEKCGRSKKGKSERKSHVFKITGIVLVIIGFMIQHVYWRSEVRREQVYWQAEVRRYKEQQAPEIDCNYEYFAKEDERKFHVKNVGLVDCTNIWVEEKLFVIVDEVYEGDDVPHFNYLALNGSRTRMWDLAKDSAEPIELQEHQRKAFGRLREKFKAKIISRWMISFSSEASSKKYYFEKYFIHLADDGMPQELGSYVGGDSILNRIKNYLAAGSKQSIKIFDLTKDFELNTPVNYYIDKDYSIVPLFPWTTLSIEEIQSLLYFTYAGQAQLADDTKGTVWYAWKYMDGNWQKWMAQRGAFTASKPMTTPFGYLSKEEQERVRNDPKLLTSQGPNRKESMKVIREKALAKFRGEQLVD